MGASEFNIKVSMPDDVYTPNEGRIIAAMTHMYADLLKTTFAAANAAALSETRLTDTQVEAALKAACRFIETAFPDVKVTVTPA